MSDQLDGDGVVLVVRGPLGREAQLVRGMTVFDNPCQSGGQIAGAADRASTGSIGHLLDGLLDGVGVLLHLQRWCGPNSSPAQGLPAVLE